MEFKEGFAPQKREMIKYPHRITFRYSTKVDKIFHELRNIHEIHIPSFIRDAVEAYIEENCIETQSTE